MMCCAPSCTITVVANPADDGRSDCQLVCQSSCMPHPYCRSFRDMMAGLNKMKLAEAAAADASGGGAASTSAPSAAPVAAAPAVPGPQRLPGVAEAPASGAETVGRFSSGSDGAGPRQPAHQVPCCLYFLLDTARRPARLPGQADICMSEQLSLLTIKLPAFHSAAACVCDCRCHLFGRHLAPANREP
jgi:hypothetical protein